MPRTTNVREPKGRTQAGAAVGLSYLAERGARNAAITSVRVRVLAGTLDGIQSPLKALLTPITFLEVHLAPDAQVEVNATRVHNSFVMIVRGGGTVANVAVEEHEALLFAHDADRVSMQGGSKGMQLLFGEGAPLNEPVVFGGPFVMTRTSDIHDARERFLRGEMGKLEASANQ